MALEWRDGDKDFKAQEGMRYLWFLVCAKGCSHVFTATVQRLDRPPYVRCPYDGTALRRMAA